MKRSWQGRRRSYLHLTLMASLCLRMTQRRMRRARKAAVTMEDRGSYLGLYSYVMVCYGMVSYVEICYAMMGKRDHSP